MLMAANISERDPTLNLLRLPSTPSSPSSSSSSDFEFTVSLSPTSKRPSHLCPADELFYKGQLLPLYIPPRVDKVRNLLVLSSSSSSSSDTSTTASRDSSGSSNDSTTSSCSISGDLLLPNDCDSSRPSSVTEDADFRKPTLQPKRTRYFSLSILSSVFHRKDKVNPSPSQSGKKIGSSAKEVLKKCVQKVKPLYVKLSPKHMRQESAGSSAAKMVSRSKRQNGRQDFGSSSMSHRLSFSGNLNHLSYPRHSKSSGLSCPSSMSSSPNHSGLLRRGGSYQDPSSVEELQSAIQGAIAHCKSSMAQSSQKELYSV